MFGVVYNEELTLAIILYIFVDEKNKNSVTNAAQNLMVKLNKVIAQSYTAKRNRKGFG